ncbi:hypothetical protein [Mesorhizobium sp. WSM2239]|uniref:FAD dependent oxidoreductase domain-containing protein n=2 Tax=unclassified Mesorhizobium TaxID=325217 RepID=A0AAU8D6A4_9HYPH
MLASAENIVIGYEPGNSYGDWGACFWQTSRNGKLVCVGGVGTGFNARTGAEMMRRLQAIQAEDTPISWSQIERSGLGPA